jgi:hypothetical protein
VLDSMSRIHGQTVQSLDLFVQTSLLSCSSPSLNLSNSIFRSILIKFGNRFSQRRSRRLRSLRINNNRSLIKSLSVRLDRFLSTISEKLHIP